MKFESGWYMASTFSIDSKYNETIGAMLTTSATNNHGIPSRLKDGVPWCLDNGVFTDKFSTAAWSQKIKSMREHTETCLFVVVPDAFNNFKATLEKFHRFRGMVKDYPIALVAQNGIQEQAEEIPWDLFDCLFIGGSDEYRVDGYGGWAINEAKRRGKWVHVGRVNSHKRIMQFWQADSWDGTHLGFMPSDVKKFHASVSQVRSMKKSKGLFDDIHNFIS